MGSDWLRSGPWIEGRRDGWIYRVMVGAEETPSGFVDVEAFSPTGDHFSGTIGTLSAIEERLGHYRVSGECLGGLYFWASGLVVVASMDLGDLLDVLADLASGGELRSAFEDVTSNG